MGPLDTDDEYLLDCAVDGMPASYLRITDDTGAAHEYALGRLPSEMVSPDLPFVFTAGVPEEVDRAHILGAAQKVKDVGGKYHAREVLLIQKVGFRAKADATTFTVRIGT